MLEERPSRPRRRSQGERSDQTRRRVTAAAARCVAELGYDRTRLSHIAERAGMTTGAIQHQFGDKQNVLLAVVQSAFDGLIEDIARLPAQALALPERIEAVVEALWARYGDPSSLAALEILIELRADARFAERALPYLADIRGSIDRLWMGLFWDAPASREGHLRGQRQLFTTLNGLVLEAMLLTSTPAPAGAPLPEAVRADLRELTERLVATIGPAAPRA